MAHVGAWELLDEVGRGGGGVVHRARDARGRLGALKLLASGPGREERLKRRFAAEVQALLRVDHPHAVRILDAGEHQGRPFLVMEWIEGESLATRLQREGPLPAREAVLLLALVARAVEHCHARGLLHRDIKPANLLLRGGRSDEPVLVDFGLTREVDPAGSRTAITQAGWSQGTPGYWAPEQARGELDRIGPATDVWGLGATLYAALTGQAPHEGQNLLEIEHSFERGAIPPSRLRPDLPPALDPFCLLPLAEHPARRPPSAQAWAEALEGWVLRPQRGVARWVGGLLLGGLCGLTILAGVTALVSRRRAEARAHQAAALLAAARVELAAGADPGAVSSRLAAAELLIGPNQATDEGAPDQGTPAQLAEAAGALRADLGLARDLQALLARPHLPGERVGLEAALAQRQGPPGPRWTRASQLLAACAALEEAEEAIAARRPAEQLAPALARAHDALARQELALPGEAAVRMRLAALERLQAARVALADARLLAGREPGAEAAVRAAWAQALSLVAEEAGPGAVVVERDVRLGLARYLLRRGQPLEARQLLAAAPPASARDGTAGQQAWLLALSELWGMRALPAVRAFQALSRDQEQAAWSDAAAGALALLVAGPPLDEAHQRALRASQALPEEPGLLTLAALAAARASPGSPGLTELPGDAGDPSLWLLLALERDLAGDGPGSDRAAEAAAERLPAERRKLVWLARAGVRSLVLSGFKGALADVERSLALDPQDFAARGGRALLRLLAFDFTQVEVLRGLERERPEEFRQLVDGLPEPSQRLVRSTLAGNR